MGPQINRLYTPPLSADCQGGIRCWEKSLSQASCQRARCGRERPGDSEGASGDGLGYGRGSNRSNDGLDRELIEFKRLDGERVQILCTHVFVLTRLVSIAVKSSTIFRDQVLPLAVPGRRPESRGATTCIRGSLPRRSERTPDYRSFAYLQAYDLKLRGSNRRITKTALFPRPAADCCRYLASPRGSGFGSG